MNKLVIATLALASVAAAQDRGARAVPGSGLIDQPGNYVLTSDAALRSTGASILITASSVSLDLNGNTVLGPSLTGAGIHISGAHGVKVSNGFIDSSGTGVVVENSTSVTLTGLQIRGEGAPPPHTGIMIVQSRNVVVEGNSIYNTGLGIFVRGGNSSGNRIANNTLTGGMNAVLGICYNPTPTDANGPRGDLVYANLVSGFNIGVQMSATSPANVVKENTIAFKTTAIDFKNVTNLDLDNTKVQLP